ncbi:hypothetical protein HPP92_018470 [Vanilla planifolia]|uniref:Uncharacterized protein n=1 Tax=Vanilla planifolia TaxID=51239 RepID=A0A835QHM2_VANPL|nr:hypothetical protein HPP92_018470 [Vanilla planifolia]
MISKSFPVRFFENLGPSDCARSLPETQEKLFGASLAITDDCCLLVSMLTAERCGQKHSESREAAAFQSSGVVNKISSQIELSQKTCSSISNQSEFFRILDYIPLSVESEESFILEEDQNYGSTALEHPLCTESCSFIPH